MAGVLPEVGCKIYGDGSTLSKICLNKTFGKGDAGIDIIFNQLFVPDIGRYDTGGNTGGNSQLLYDGKSKAFRLQRGFWILFIGNFRSADCSAFFENHLHRPADPDTKGFH